MKNNIIIVFILSIFFNTQIFAQESTYQIEKIVEFLALGTGSTTGTYFPLGNAFAHVWTQKSKKINVMSHSTNGSFENIELLRNHEINLAIAQSDIVSDAINGKGKFKEHPFSNLKILMALYPEVIQIVVTSSSKIEKIEELKGHTINVGPANSGNAITAVELLKALDINENEYNLVNMSYDEVIQAMEKDECDATIIIAGVPTKAIVELSRRKPIKILNVPFQTVMETVKKLPYLSGYHISNEVYGFGGSVSTIAVTALLVSNDSLKDEIAYDLISMIFNNLDYIRNIHDRAKDISMKNALKGIKESNLHSGSVKYFNENKNK